MSQEVNASHVAMLRGVKNCGSHHEENATAPAIQFAQACDCCAGHIFAVIWNAGVDAHLQNVLGVVRGRR